MASIEKLQKRLAKLEGKAERARKKISDKMNKKLLREAKTGIEKPAKKTKVKKADKAPEQRAA